MPEPLKPVQLPVPKPQEIVTIRLPDGTVKQVTREQLEAQKRQKGEQT